jgi:hypothetical protein
VIWNCPLRKVVSFTISSRHLMMVHPRRPKKFGPSIPLWAVPMPHVVIFLFCCLILFQWLAKDATSILWDEPGIRPTLLRIGTIVMGHKLLRSRAPGSPLLNHRYSDNTVATSRRWSSLLWPLVAIVRADVIRPSLLGP